MEVSMLPFRRALAAPAVVVATAAFATLLPGCAAVDKPVPDAPRVGGLAVSHEATCLHGSEAVEVEIGFCQAVRTGRTVHISGVVAAGPMDQAVPRVYASLAKVLAANGLTFADVVKETVYATDLDAFIANKERRKAFYTGRLPAATWVQVQRLYLPSFVVEVEVTAEVPQ
jgi:enamine deaminase RidA (YjgF/YER057c/UK114 family)